MTAVLRDARRAACTITTAAYQAQAACLVDSYLSHHPDDRCVVLHVDEPRDTDPRLERPGVVHVRLADLRIQGLAAMRARYSTFELCNALKPFLLRHLFGTTSLERVCYCDGDLFFFDSIEQQVWHTLDRASVLLTPHLARVPSEEPDLIWRDLAVLQHGVYNGGFLALRRCPDVDRFLEWWSDRTRRLGQKKLEEGLNCDQRWLDLLPGFDLDCHVSRHPGLNAAYWNLHERRFARHGDRHVVNGEPLVFFHFSGYAADRPDLITRHPTAFTFDTRPDLRPVFEAYQRALLGEPSIPAAPRSSTAACDSPPVDVSVVIPACNAGRYLAAAIGSVLTQTLPAIEIIVVDDGSADDTAAVAEQFVAAQGARVRLLRTERSGVGAARNRGIDAARGRYVAFLDADDWYLDPTKLARQAAILDARPDAGIVHSGWQQVDADGSVVIERRPWIQAPVLDLEGWLLWQPALPSAMMLRRAALDEVGGFDATLGHLEDVDLALRVTAAGYTTVWLEEVTVAYRRHEANASRRLHDTEVDIHTVLDRFFARPDLPDSSGMLANRARCGALKWLALQYCHAGAHGDAVRVLQTMLPLQRELPPLAALLEWIDGFDAASPIEFGKPFDVYALTSRPEWQALLRTQLLGPATEAAGASVARVMPPTRRAAPAGTGDAVAGDGNLTTHVEMRWVGPAGAPPKLDLTGALSRDYGRHRSGWGHAMRALMPLHRDNGVWVDAFPEHTFDGASTLPAAPHRRPWVGFLHNPPEMPDWFVPSQSPHSLLASDAFRASLPHCRGLFCLSEYLAQWWRARVDLPIDVVRLPTAEPPVMFSLERFGRNPRKRVVQVGSWLRKLHSVHYLPVQQLQRTIAHQHRHYIDDLLATERQVFKLRPDDTRVETLPFLDDDAYDALLADNIVYLDLYDSSANNVVVECIARATPVLVNPLPAVVEYLGPAYPFYFSSRGQAARKAEDVAQIEAAHRYLMERRSGFPLSGEAFSRAVAVSALYQALEAQP